MRNYLTRTFFVSHAKIGFYDMLTNKMKETDSFNGQFKNTDQVLRYVKRNKEKFHIPEGKQVTVLFLDIKKEQRRMTYQEFYEHSEPVPEAASKKVTPEKTSGKKQNNKNRK